MVHFIKQSVSEKTAPLSGIKKSCQFPNFCYYTLSVQSIEEKCVPQPSMHYCEMGSSTAKRHTVYCKQIQTKENNKKVGFKGCKTNTVSSFKTHQVGLNRAVKAKQPNKCNTFS